MNQLLVLHAQEPFDERFAIEGSQVFKVLPRPYKAHRKP